MPRPDRVAELAASLVKAKRVYLIGNGGSAANALHIANDLVACGIKAHALTGDIATITAMANDFSYEQIFSLQIRAFGEPGDMLWALSGSGKSANIIAALKAAKEKGMETWVMIGEYSKGSPANQLADHTIYFGKDMQQSEERQLYIGHSVMRAIKNGG